MILLGNLRETTLWFELYPETYKNYDIMLWTGVKDKTNALIWESDILKHQYRGQGEVIYEAPGFRVTNDKQDIWLGHTSEKRRRVIGNIYENPELKC